MSATYSAVALQAATLQPPNCTVIRNAIMTGNGSLADLPAPCWRYNTPARAVISIILGALIVGTAVGNMLVILAVGLVKKLQTPSNLLIVSLAVSDFTVALFVLPFATYKQLSEEMWLLSHALCDTFIICDVLLCSSSILNLCAISIDRYLVITRPFSYAANRTPFRMGVMIVIAWIVAALISVPPVLGWKKPHQPGQCNISDDLGYQIYATFGAFYLPLLVMLILYGRIFKLAHKMAKADAKQKPTVLTATAARGSSGSGGGTLDTSEAGTGAGTPETHEGKRLIRFSGGDGEASLPNGERSTSFVDHLPMRRQARQNAQKNTKAKSKSKSNSETKAIKTLGVIMGCFTLCWLPFFIMQLISPILKVAKVEDLFQIPPDLADIFVWLGYLNSFLNPIIYAKFNRDFRTPFKEILMCRCGSINARLRSESYAEQYGLPMHTVRRDTGHTRRKSSDLVTKVNRKGKVTNTLGNGAGAEHV